MLLILSSQAAAAVESSSYQISLLDGTLWGSTQLKKAGSYRTLILVFPIPHQLPSRLLLLPATLGEHCHSTPVLLQYVGISSHCVLPKVVVVAKMTHHEKVHSQVLHPLLDEF